MDAHQKRLPEFKPPGGLQIWQLGIKHNWPKLRAILDGFRDFSVIDAVSEDHLQGIARDIQGSQQSDWRGYSILHWVCSEWTAVSNVSQHDNVELVKDLLALGIDSNLPNDSNQTPAHLCSAYDRPIKCPEVIGMCRPDLSAKDINGSTPIGIAMQNASSHAIWGVFKGGFPTIAQLAHEKKWWAVKNLTRRRVIPEAEMSEKYAGKDAIEWAEHYEEQRIAEELWYLFGKSTVCRLVKLERSADEDFKKVNAGLEKFQTEFQAFQANLEVDIDVLKEALTICTSRIGEIATVEEESNELMNEADQATKLEAMEEKLLSKVDAKLKKFQHEFQDLQQALKARDEMVEAQMKAVREEVAKLSITAAAGSRLPSGVPALPNAPQDSTAMQGASASHSEQPRGFDLAATNIPMLMELLAVMEKYRR